MGLCGIKEVLSAIGHFSDEHVDGLIERVGLGDGLPVDDGGDGYPIAARHDRRDFP